MSGNQELEHQSPRTFEPPPKRTLFIPDNRKFTPTDILVVKEENAFTFDKPKVKSPLIVRPPVLFTPPPDSIKSKFKFVPDNPEGLISNFLIEVRKTGGKFWVGVAVPADTTDFTRAHVFFHPQVAQAGADDKDYPDFVGGWPGDDKNIQRFVNIIGGQLAAAKSTVPVLVPFMTMAAVQKPTGSSNVFADRPLRTLNAVMGLIQDEVTGKKGSKPELTAIVTSSFSSGVTAMKLFIGTMAGTKVIKEVIDLDGPFIIGDSTKAPIRVAGAVSRTFTQIDAPPGVAASEWITLKERHFAAVPSFFDKFGSKKLHQQIGNHMLHGAMTVTKSGVF